MSFQRLRGTKDIFGSEADLFQHIDSTARQVFHLFGFEELRTPIFEEKKLFTRALGAETDVVQKEMYEFLDRSKTEVALRPEGTAGVVRAYLENNLDKTKGHCKFYYTGPMFRSERPQAGRLRQFHQIGVEELGTDSPYADAEIIHCLTFFLERCGAGGFQLKINNLGTLEERGKFEKILYAFFKPHEKSLCEDCQKRLSKNIFRVLDCKLESCRKVIQISPVISDSLSPESRDHFSRVCESLEKMGVSYRLAPHLVRGLDYYTKTVFEISHPDLGAQDALAAGGRYDGLVETFGGPRTGAVGFAVGVERLVLCISKMKEAVAWQDCVFIATLGEAAFQKGFELLSKLRGEDVPCVMDFQSKSLKSQMRAADKAKSRIVIILGDEELQEQKFVLKDMQTGAQEKCALTEIVPTLRRRFAC